MPFSSASRSGPYGHEPIYGDGHAGERIAAILAENEISIHKRMSY